MCTTDPSMGMGMQMQMHSGGCVSVYLDTNHGNVLRKVRGNLLRDELLFVSATYTVKELEDDGGNIKFRGTPWTTVMSSVDSPPWDPLNRWFFCNMSIKASDRSRHDDYYVRYLDQSAGKDLEFYKTALPNSQEAAAAAKPNTWSIVINNTAVTRRKSLHLG